MILDVDHSVLLISWIFYGFLHSALAATRVKSFFSTLLGAYFRYYRLFYSIFAAISLAVILIYQYSFYSPLLLQVPEPVRWLMIPFLLAGLLIMAICIRKYFYYLSGIDVLFPKPAEAKLDTGGIHQYVRHPLYSGTLLTIWALLILFPYSNNLIAATVITAYTILGAGFEERKLIRQFGSAYIDYKHKVPMLIPFLFRKKILNN